MFPNPDCKPTNEEEMAAAYIVASASGVGPVAFHHIIAVNASTERSFADFLSLTDRQRRRDYGLSLKRRDDYVRMTTDEAAESLEKMNRAGTRLLFSFDVGYPSRLREALEERAPAFLFVRGVCKMLGEPSVAVIGTRAPSEWGTAMAEQVATDVVDQGHVVLSGYAAGVDSIAHHAALQAGGQTALVLNHGIEQFDPTPEIADAVEQGRAVAVSQFQPFERFTAGTAMARNRVVAALAGRVVAVETGEIGGTMRTSSMATELRRPLYAPLMPRPDETPEGNRRLLELGARALACEETGDPEAPWRIDLTPLWDESDASTDRGQAELPI